MGGVNDSYPPGCTGPTIHGWDWDSVDGEKRAANVIWGDYEVRGIWDGASFTVSKQPPQSFTPPTEPPRNRPVDPLLDPRNRGTGAKSRLEQIQRALWDSGQPVLSETQIENGYLFLWVPYDDGSIQAEMDKRFGPNLVAVRNAFLPAN
ncbi:hypothetical protein [uncultured Arthrobacter sp.]|uniref:hypothetical protein n=1 Tax=uncultured Arthrobacter sp. TaxID=114050 RepID=UPI0028D60BFF|nr:hypothetical protein [uncultured Arthrobacter sp.]